MYKFFNVKQRLMASSGIHRPDAYTKHVTDRTWEAWQRIITLRSSGLTPRNSYFTNLDLALMNFYLDFRSF